MGRRMEACLWHGDADTVGDSKRPLNDRGWYASDGRSPGKTKDRIRGFPDSWVVGARGLSSPWPHRLLPGFRTGAYLRKGGLPSCQSRMFPSAAVCVGVRLQSRIRANGPARSYGSSPGPGRKRRLLHTGVGSCIVRASRADPRCGQPPLGDECHRGCARGNQPPRKEQCREASRHRCAHRSLQLRHLRMDAP